MLTRQRKELLLARLKRDGQIVARSLSEELGLSEDTIRRDLRELAAEGLLQRVHGGALPLDPPLPPSPALGNFSERQQISSDAKPAIARAAAAMITPGQVVFIDGGTTAVQLARALPPTLRCTVVTHSPSVAVELAEHPLVEVILIGGRLFKHSIVAMGPAALEAIAQIRTDIYFMGVCSLHPESGISTGDFDEAGVKRAISNMAQRTVVLASPEKLDTASPYQIAPLSQVSAIIVNGDAPETLLARYRELGIDVTKA
ncbi:MULTISPECIES: DeoR/GlpR family DNA-binding transcription regulator [unclassified Duganella]|uniref:DeoR/GlpR family DNA-binding transcription regulator n=1 Tax=unclassified Duganella TaxID=2636909 RepID=UPI00088A3B4C|nr:MULTISPECIES: DeoR/GlpR family DNA-binding transcription regulator [unclassified Duganella]SDG65507.1 transcriptional regulator, DeoR family [Duganella sp. OV458]SDJ90765.1 transcriptional regulator, DeoR family [Duganella sp. OV510]